LTTAAQRIAAAITFFIPGYLLLPLVMIGRGARTSTVRFALAGVALTAVGVLVSVYYQAHYFAPAAAPLIAIFAVCLERLADGDGPFGTFRRGFAWATVVIWAVPAFTISVGSLPGGPWHVPVSDWAVARARLADSLAAAGGAHLLFVAYPPNYSPHDEWVFNGANVATQPVIWAHDLGMAKNAELLSHFPQTRAHLLTVGDSAPFYRLRPF
jgi:hypothetical protein